MKILLPLLLSLTINTVVYAESSSSNAGTVAKTVKVEKNPAIKKDNQEVKKPKKHKKYVGRKVPQGISKN